MEDQLIFLYEIRAEYLQEKPKLLDMTQLPFDKKVTIEIEKIEKLRLALQRQPPAEGHRLSEEYMDNQEFMQMLKVSKRTAQNWREKGVIAFTQIGSKVYYKISDVEHLLKKNYVGAVVR